MTNPLLAAAVWHERLAEIHSAAPDKEGAATLFREVEKLEKKSADAASSKNVVERLKAAPLLREAKQKRFIAGAIGSMADAEAHVTHFLAAAQIRASAEGKNITVAAHTALQKLMACGDPKVMEVAKNHATTKILGVTLPKPEKFSEKVAVSKEA